MRRQRINAFTVIELLVAVGIILLLVGILIPAMGHFRSAARSSAIKAFLGTIQTGLIGYGNDNRRELPPSDALEFYNIPDVFVGGSPHMVKPLGIRRDQYWTNNTDYWNGGEILAQALAGPNPPGDLDDDPVGDGVIGYGFMPSYGRGAGKTFGPYIDVKDELNIRPRFNNPQYSQSQQVRGPNYKGLSTSERQQAYVFTLATGRQPMPFLYYRANPNGQTGADPNVAGTAILGTDGMFDLDHNRDLYGNDRDGNATNPVNWWKGLGTAEQETFAVGLRSADYLLFHAGPDEFFGTDDDVYITGKANQFGF